MAIITFEELERELKPKQTYNIKHRNFNAIKIDSRLIEKGDVFIALCGKNHDAHKFIPDVFKAGAYLAIVQKSVEYPHLLVENTFEALKKVAGYMLEKSKAKSIAVTGSSGKTTTKDLICSILKNRNCHKTKENENNFIGVSKTLLGVGNSNVCVVEAGTNHRGEMTEIAKFFKPDIAVFTNIGASHIGNFKSLENIVQEKISLLSDKTYAVYNYDDRYLRKHLKGRGCSCSLINPEADVFISSAGKDSLIVECMGRKIEIKPPKDINIYNILLALASAVLYDKNISDNEINDGLQSFSPQHLRMQKELVGNTEFILDCYNANPDSVKYAISVTGKKEGKKLAILGDMLELGELSKDMHKKIGEYLLNFDIDLIAYGKDAKFIYEQMKNASKNALFFDNKESLSDYLKDTYQNYDIILIKGSRGMKMEEIFYALKKENN